MRNGTKRAAGNCCPFLFIVEGPSMKLHAALVTIFLMAYTLSAQTVQIPLSFANVLPTGLSTFSFSVGAHPAATVGVDTSLKEQEIPSLPPPAGVFIVYSVPPTPDFIWLSPRDIRPLKIGEKQLITYEIGVTWNGGRLEIGWGQMPKFVDSAYITDVITDFPDNFIKQKLLPGVVYSTTNSAITKLKVLVWYDATEFSSVDAASLISQLTVYPNPSDGFVRVKGAEQGSTVIVRDMTGKVCSEAVLESSEHSIDLSACGPGVYSMSISDLQGHYRTSMIVRR
ncbi:MAG TPA: hypothetical protein DCZ59_01585 [Bacteroidetes bacterium]|nr:hypothetical protein [Bacteroidota bacterium]